MFPSCVPDAAARRSDFAPPSRMPREVTNSVSERVTPLMSDVSQVAHGGNGDHGGREWIVGSCRVAVVAQVLLVHSTDTEQD